MSGITPRGFKLNSIVDKLALDLLIILGDALTEPTLNQERLVLRILLTLSKKHYVNELLFRDFNLSNDMVWSEWSVLPQLIDGKIVNKVRIHNQSLVYLETVLMRRLTLANNREELPTNMHLLLKKLCQYGNPEPFWKSVELKRDKHQIPKGEDNLFFQRIAKRLAAQCQQLGNHCSDIAQRRREQYGSLWLLLADCVAEVPEKLALFFEVLEALPLPLAPDFANDPDLQCRLNRVLKAFNERYMLLRSCGLNPDNWMEREELSINELREMKRLRNWVKDNWVESKENHLESAYRNAFNQLQGEQKKFAGYPDFEEFAASEWGMIMLNYSAVYLNHSANDDDPDEEETLQDQLTIPDEESGYAQLGVREYNEEYDKKSAFAQCDAREGRYQLVETYPNPFGNDPVLIYFFCEILSFNQNFPPADPEFNRLLKTNPKYAQLSDQELLTVLSDKVDKIIEECIKPVKKRLYDKQQR
jgi:hypothetical protein